MCCWSPVPLLDVTYILQLCVICCWSPVPGPLLDVTYIFVQGLIMPAILEIVSTLQCIDTAVGPLGLPLVNLVKDLKTRIL